MNEKVTHLSPTATLAFLIPALGSCTGLETKRNTLGPLQALSAQADARNVYVNASSGYNNGRFVAEPPPDASVNLTQSISAIAKASETKGLGAVELQFVSKLAREMSKMGVRSQGLSYLRDAGYRLNEAFVNGAFFPHSYSLPVSTVVQAAKDYLAGGATQVDERLTQLQTASELLPETPPDLGSIFPGKTTIMSAIKTLRKTNAPNKEQLADARDTIARVASLGETNYMTALANVLNNAKELIEAEVRVNPTLSTPPDEPQGMADEPLPRLKVDITPGSSEAQIAFRNPMLTDVDINVDVMALSKDDVALKKESVTIRLDMDGSGAVKWALPEQTVVLKLRAPTSTPLVRKVPSPPPPPPPPPPTSSTPPK